MYVALVVVVVPCGDESSSAHEFVSDIVGLFSLDTKVWPTFIGVMYIFFSQTQHVVCSERRNVIKL